MVNPGRNGNTATSHRISVETPTGLSALDQHFLEIMNPAQKIQNVALCDKHRNTPDCADCRNEVMTKTRLQRAEERILSASITYTDDKKWMVNGQYKNLESLPEYYEESLIFMEKLRKKLLKNPDGRKIAETMDETVRNNIESGIWK